MTGAARAAAAGGAGPDDAERVRLFGAAYRMLGSACEAEETVRDAVHEAARTAVRDPACAAARDGGRHDVPDGVGDAAGRATGSQAGPDLDVRLPRELFGAVLRQSEAVHRGRREGHAGPWLPEPVLTAGGVLGRLETAEAREGVSMARLVLLERLSPAERAVHVLREVFGYGPAESAAVLELPEARCRSLLRRARQRVRESEALARAEADREQRWLVAEELVRGIREQDRVALEELLNDDVVAWSDGGGQPGVARRPVLGAVKVGRFLAGLQAKSPEGTRGTVMEVNGDAAVVAAADSGVVGVLAPEFGERGLVGIRLVADPVRLVFLSRQWAADRAGR